MPTSGTKSIYEALYECLGTFRLPSGFNARPGDLARETEIRGHESQLVATGDLRLVGFVRRGAQLG